MNEGGGIHVDGEGTVLLTETVQLDPRRNPYTNKQRVEWELQRTIGATNFIWLPRGLTRDYESAGTRGHVDMVATFAAPGRVLLHWQDDPSHPDYAVVRQVRAVLEQATDAAGRSLEIIELPAPETLRDEDGFVDWNYANHLVVNGGVIACGYGEPDADGRAAAILGDAYGREVVTIDARPILQRGGGIHCITQQQPEVESRDDRGRGEHRSPICARPWSPVRRRRSRWSRPISPASRHMTRTAYASTRSSSSTPMRGPRPSSPTADGAKARRSARSTASRTRRRTATWCAG